MTKERKLAIDMWLWIRERYDEWDFYFWGASDEDGCVDEMKYRFIDAENNGEYPNWKSLCWLCNYMGFTIPTPPEKLYSCGHCPPKELFSCKRCPLKSCYASDTAYQVLDKHLYKGDIFVSEEVYRDCCTTILNALGYKGE